MLRRFIAPMLLLLTLMLAPGPASAVPPLKVALFDVAPYVVKQQGREPSGRYVMLARELAHAAGLDIDLLILPFARIGPALADGQADLTIGFATESVDKAALRLGNVMAVESLVVTKLGRPVLSLAQLAGYRIGRARGACQHLAQVRPPRMELVDINGFDSGIRMLARGRLDGLCLTREVLQHYLQLTGVTRAELGTELVVSRRMVGVFVRRDLDAGIVARLRTALLRSPPP